MNEWWDRWWQMAALPRYGMLAAVSAGLLLISWVFWLRPQQQALIAEQQKLLQLFLIHHRCGGLATLGFGDPPNLQVAGPHRDFGVPIHDGVEVVAEDFDAGRNSLGVGGKYSELGSGVFLGRNKVGHHGTCSPLTVNTTPFDINLRNARADLTASRLLGCDSPWATIVVLFRAFTRNLHSPLTS